MNLDDFKLISALDQEHMLDEICQLPNQLERAYQIGLAADFPRHASIRAVILAGMGGSAAGADLLAAFTSPMCSVPVIVHRDYDLPGWAKGKGVLVITSSHSGNTEESLSAYTAAIQQGCSTLAISTGGKLMQKAKEAGLPHWQFVHVGQPRAAVGFSFGLLAAAVVRSGLLSDLKVEIGATVKKMQEQMTAWMPEVPVAKNRAKRDAGQLVGRWVTVFGCDHLAPVARRWKNQINELAKAWAGAETLPEADHNTLAGTLHPENQLVHSLALFLEAPGCHPRNQARADLTRQFLMQEGIGTDSFVARGETRLEQLWSALHYGDFLAFYLAMAYGVNPTPVEALEVFKGALREI